MRRTIIIVIVFVFIAVIYLLGPAPVEPIYSTQLPQLPPAGNGLEQYISNIESRHKLKPGNNAEVIWNDSSHKKTKYALVYLHGFSASRQEGYPVHVDMAKKFNCNLYLSRLSQHGIDTADAMVNLTAQNLWESARDAYDIGLQLGDSVILMGTSTGGSLALQLASEYHNIAALILMSPNIEINDANAWLLNNHWGLQIARKVVGSNYNQAKTRTAEYKKYWNYRYRLEAAVALQEYLETAMTKTTFEKVAQPVLAMYYYKDEQHQDPVVRVSAIKKMMSEISTPVSKKRAVPIPNAENHVLGSYIVSKDVPSVEAAAASFLSDIIK